MEIKILVNIERSAAQNIDIPVLFLWISFMRRGPRIKYLGIFYHINSLREDLLVGVL